MRYSTSGMNKKRNIYWFSFDFFYNVNESFYPKIIKNGFRPLMGIIFKSKVWKWYTRSYTYKETRSINVSQIWKGVNKWFDLLIFIYQTKRCVNKDLNTYKYKWSKGNVVVRKIFECNECSKLTRVVTEILFFNREMLDKILKEQKDGCCNQI